SRWRNGMSDEFDHLFPAVRPIAALGARERDGVKGLRAPASLKNSGASLINSAPTCLRNSDSESHEPRSEPGAKALSLSNSGRPTPAIQGPESIDPRPNGRENRRLAGLSSDPKATTRAVVCSRSVDLGPLIRNTFLWPKFSGFC